MRLVDGILGGSFALVGASILSIAIAIVGLAWWAATVMRPSGFGTALARAALGLAGTLAWTTGLFFLAVGAESVAGFPLGPSSGGTVLIAWWLGTYLAARDLVVTASLLRRLADASERRDAALLSSLVRLAALGAWVTSKVFALLVFMVALDVLVLP